MSAIPSSQQPQLDKYELLEEIGHGGMATVYRARDLRLDREVAVKVIHKHLRENPEVRRRFVSEARAVAKLRHRSIVNVYDVSDEEDDERYLVAELIRGPTLRRLLQQHQVLPAEIGAGILALLCEAVQHAHDCGVIHRDIKPENVLIELPGAAQPSQSGSDPPPQTPRSPDKHRPDSSSGGSESGRLRIKLTDFGIAKVLDHQGLTSTGQILGSPAHMAPEQIEGGKIGPHTDVFALGVLLYECVVGHLPFDGKNPAQVLRRVLDGDFEPADSERPEVGGRWAGIIEKALQSDIESRLPSAAELGALIAEELNALEISDPRGQVTDYFAAPEAYRAEQAERLVPLLLKRGERARKRGLIHSAAADFNRALAFRPDDLAIMKRISTLSAETVWRRRAYRFGAIAAGSALLCTAAYGVTRWLRTALAESGVHAVTTTAPVVTVTDRGAVTSSALRTSAPVKPAPTLTVPPTAPAKASTGTVSNTTEGSTKAPVLPPSSAPTTRRVSFIVNPKGARVTVGGETRSGFDLIFRLKPGSYTVKAEMPAGSTCCDPLSQPITVELPPEGDPDKIQPIPLYLPLRQASVLLVGAPPGATISCPMINVSGPAGTALQFQPTKHNVMIGCTVSPSGKSLTFPMRAGELNRVTYVE